MYPLKPPKFDDDPLVSLYAEPHLYEFRHTIGRPTSETHQAIRPAFIAGHRRLSTCQTSLLHVSYVEGMFDRWEAAAGGKLETRVIKGASHVVEQEHATAVLCE